MLRFKNFLLLLIASLLLASCAVEELELESKEPVSGSRVVRTKSAQVVLTRRDSLRLLYEYQTRSVQNIIHKFEFSFRRTRRDNQNIVTVRF